MPCPSVQASRPRSASLAAFWRSCCGVRSWAVARNPRAGLVRPALAGEVEARKSDRPERGQLQVGAQFWACSRRVTSRSPYFAQLAGSAADLLRHPQDDRLGQLAVGSQRVTGVAQRAELHGEAEAVGVAASLADQRQVGVVEGVVADQVIPAFRQRKQVSRSVAEGSSDAACQSSVRRYW